jgi:hypothetical protein
MERYRVIPDAETYLANCQANAATAQQHYQQLAAQASQLNTQLAGERTKLIQYQQLLGRYKSIADLQQRIETDKTRVRQLAATLGKLETAAQLDNLISDRQRQLESLTQTIGAARSVEEIAAQAKYYENYVAQLKADVEAVEEARSLQEFGFYRPRYDFASSELYANRLDDIRARQKRMLSEKKACTCDTEWTVDGDKREGKKMVDQQIKLMLRAFNGESDAAVAKVSYSNVVSLENRLRKSFDQINALGEAKRIYLDRDFFNLKYEELHLAYEYQRKKQDEKEEQRAIREQMKEEEKVAKEIDKARESAERDEAVKSQALERARAELAATAGQQTAKLQTLIERLENELKDALDRKAKAIARAQLTKSGHVYILSNIGTFGEGVYKIGMSRRLEPLDRVAELGGASVPFPFDVHAMIYSENAPELENLLHRHFAHRRVNLVNLRREFFRITLDEIRAAVAENFGKVTFVLEPEAEQYRLTVAKLKDLEKEQRQLQIA